MITEGEAAILLETTQRAFRNQSQSKQRSTLVVENIYLLRFKAHTVFFLRCVFIKSLKTVKHCFKMGFTSGFLSELSFSCVY